MLNAFLHTVFIVAGWELGGVILRYIKGTRRIEVYK